MPTKSPPGLVVLRTLIDRHKLKASDLKKEIGSKSAVSLVLSGQRNLTRAHIEKLSARFKVNPGVFFDPVQSSVFTGNRPRVPRRNLLDPQIEPEERAQDALLTDMAIKATERASKVQQNLLQGLQASIRQAIAREH